MANHERPGPKQIPRTWHQSPPCDDGHDAHLKDEESLAIFESLKLAATVLAVGLPVSLIGVSLATAYGSEGHNVGYWFCAAMVVGGLVAACCGAASLWRIFPHRKDL